ncbi:MAG: isoaspartyl peptidase/L-asparaginase family protein [Bacteroidota bacterium]
MKLLAKLTYFWTATFLLMLCSCNLESKQSIPVKNQQQEVEELQTNQSKSNQFGIALHGGAGTIQPEMMSDSIQKAYENKLTEAIQLGHQILENGGNAETAVVKVIQILEDSPLFNAGKGAVMTAEHTHELDASIMNGSDLSAGAVAGVKSIKNPILLAQEIMHNSNHVLLTGKGAEEFAQAQGLEMIDNDYFFTQKAERALKNAQDKENKARVAYYEELIQNQKFGTVGCVALDKNGNLSAGTSTGGMTNKKYGRIGDSPIIGAGNYANNQTCAVSATGHGEYFIKNVVAHDISAMMSYAEFTLEQATQIVIQEKLKSQQADGGVIAIDHQGNISMEFNTPGMFRAQMDAKGNLKVAMFKD